MSNTYEKYCKRERERFSIDYGVNPVVIFKKYTEEYFTHNFPKVSKIGKFDGFNIEDIEEF